MKHIQIFLDSQQDLQRTKSNNLWEQNRLLGNPRLPSPTRATCNLVTSHTPEMTSKTPRSLSRRVPKIFLKFPLTATESLKKCSSSSENWSTNRYTQKQQRGIIGYFSNSLSRYSSEQQRAEKIISYNTISVMLDSLLMMRKLSVLVSLVNAQFPEISAHEYQHRT